MSFLPLLDKLLGFQPHNFHIHLASIPKHAIMRTFTRQTIDSHSIVNYVYIIELLVRALEPSMTVGSQMLLDVQSHYDSKWILDFMCI